MDAVWKGDTFVTRCQRNPMGLNFGTKNMQILQPVLSVDVWKGVHVKSNFKNYTYNLEIFSLVVGAIYRPEHI